MAGSMLRLNFALRVGGKVLQEGRHGVDLKCNQAMVRLGWKSVHRAIE